MKKREETSPGGAILVSLASAASLAFFSPFSFPFCFRRSAAAAPASPSPASCERPPKASPLLPRPKHHRREMDRGVGPSPPLPLAPSGKSSLAVASVIPLCFLAAASSCGVPPRELADLFGRKGSRISHFERPLRKRRSAGRASSLSRLLPLGCCSFLHCRCCCCCFLPAVLLPFEPFPSSSSFSRCSSVASELLRERAMAGREPKSTGRQSPAPRASAAAASTRGSPGSFMRMRCGSAEARAKTSCHELGGGDGPREEEELLRSQERRRRSRSRSESRSRERSLDRGDDTIDDDDDGDDDGIEPAAAAAAAAAASPAPRSLCLQGTQTGSSEPRERKNASFSSRGKSRESASRKMRASASSRIE